MRREPGPSARQVARHIRVGDWSIVGRGGSFGCVRLFLVEGGIVSTRSHHDPADRTHRIFNRTSCFRRCCQLIQDPGSDPRSESFRQLVGCDKTTRCTWSGALDSPSMRPRCMEDFVRSRPASSETVESGHKAQVDYDVDSSTSCKQKDDGRLCTRGEERWVSSEDGGEDTRRRREEGMRRACEKLRVLLGSSDSESRVEARWSSRSKMANA
ncbi:hypothetical protein FA95DRAFT_1357403 [Auriscalpium vulgare]|uniref:Uncharacterized protein n=1 Tax=Auriscalpium vulgare TaxID=40419 RepID=A0ACB8R263_9AGAM|nr:hypothetical protein FA95DRAFT_1357403 [Auriscalpium vulgare]